MESLLAFHSESSSGDSRSSDDSVGDHTTDSPKAPFAPGEVFAGRYRMITRIGRGGMGDVWRADDLILETPVALKLILRSGQGARDRILNEVRLARQITHPAVCRVFDVGEADGQVFFSMELVRGEDLATLRRRVGRLSSEKVLDIAVQLCDGLAAAHAQGVLHRDLKPANILIDDDGCVRITDFGIAITRTDEPRRSLTGTPGYMAPEQQSIGGALSERTDVYALGLVLYELLVGHHPFHRASEPTPPRPSGLVPDVNPQLEHVILRALSPNPHDRPQSALEMGEAFRRTSDPDIRRTSQPWLIGAAIAAVVVLAATSASYFMSRAGGALTAQDTIVLADFANTTDERVFDGALKVALAVALEQSPFLKMFPDDRVKETLQMMGRPPDQPITRPIAREIARREGLKALMAGSIAGLGRNYVVTIEAVNAGTGDIMAREQVEVQSKEGVLTALGGAASKLREKLGESLASIEKFDVPLARATTSSLEALHAYSLALDQGTVNPRLEAVPHLKRAIELDPNFALALAFLATVYSNTGQTTLAPEYAARAFALRDRVSERERFFVSFRYYRDATQDWEEALELSRLWTATYPREAFAFNSLGTAYTRFGFHQQSIEPFRQAIKLEPKFVAPYSNLAGTFLALNRFDEADQLFRDAAAQKIDSFSLRRAAYLAALIENDSAAMARHFSTSMSLDATSAAYGWQAHTAALTGQARHAHELFRRGMTMALQGGFKEVAGQLSVEDGEVHMLMGDCTAARQEVDEGVSLTRDNYALERASRTLAMCGVETEAATLLRELGMRYSDATLTTRIAMPLAAAAGRLRHGQPKRAIELLEPVRRYEHAPKAEFWPSYLRGLALMETRNPAAALAEFQAILDHRGEYPNAPLYAFAHLGAARAAAASGALDKARAEYDAFVELWKDASPDLPPLKDARRELAALGAPQS